MTLYLARQLKPAFGAYQPKGLCDSYPWHIVQLALTYLGTGTQDGLWMR